MVGPIIAEKTITFLLKFPEETKAFMREGGTGATKSALPKASPPRRVKVQENKSKQKRYVRLKLQGGEGGVGEDRGAGKKGPGKKGGQDGDARTSEKKKRGHGPDKRSAKGGGGTREGSLKNKAVGKAEKEKDTRGRAICQEGVGKRTPGNISKRGLKCPIVRAEK